ncbi:MAG: 50S ribosomal protein L9 [Sphaerochaetaceae bacterium]|nr:50S ribosomal protein L9 [Sphaerochaetaceae bacterium]NLV84009.1 50S ribosomal protein L9 [Spirochaetales bacterium]
MKIILNQDVQNLGEEGDVVEVKNGYARNFLLPNGYAVLYNNANKAMFASRAAAIEKRKQEKRSAAASLKDRLDAVTITLSMSAGESGKLFGSVTSAMVQEALAKLDIEVDRKRIEVASHAIKMVGTFSVKIRLYENESATVKLVVVNEAELKKAAAEKAAADKATAKAAAAQKVEEPKVEEPEYGAEGEQELEEETEEEA